jgi:hypothetical protein
MNEIEAAIRVIIDLLVRGECATIERLTRGRRLSGRQLEAAVAEYGRHLVPVGEGWWETVTVTPIDVGDHGAFHVAAPLWTREEGRSDLTLEVRLDEFAPRAYESEVLDLHVL